MAHKHPVYDTDKHFSIDPVSRKITNECGKLNLQQYDHDSERFTFEIPKEVDGHDMSLCNVVQIHYLNIEAANKSNKYAGIYEVDDLQTGTDDAADIVFGSWLISGNATQYVGSLNFVVRFACVADDGTIEYAWNTAIHSTITIGEGICNSDAVAAEYADILEQWRQELFNGSGGGSGTDGADGEDGGYYTPTVTQTDENTMKVSFTASKEGMAAVATQNITLPSGKDGEPGADGEDGFSPVVTLEIVEDITSGKGVQISVQNKDSDQVATVYDGKDGTSAFASVSKENGVTTITTKDASGTHTAEIKDGADGSPGQDGSDGVGIASIEQTTTSTEDGGNNVFTVTLTNGNNATFTVKNGSTGSTGATGDPGKDGSDGEPGADGADGYSPTAKVTQTDSGATITITDKNGTTTATIANGKDGADGSDGANGNVFPLFYISPSGIDSNDGLTADTPKKTVAAAVAAGAKRISAKRGTYAEQVSLSNIDYLEIFPTDNDQEYSTDADWTPITFDLSDTLEVGGLETYNSIKRIAYTNSANEQFDKVFTKQSQSGVIGTGYNATVWIMSNNEKTVCTKLKPVLSVAECEAEADTFSWVDGYIYINADMTGVEKICVPTNWDSGFRIANAGKVILREVEVRLSGSYNVWLLNCPFFDFYKVSARYSSYASGIDIDNANGTLTACYATKNYDGFGISGYGHTTYIDCVSEFNTDDGVSHHNGSCGTFIGGRFEGNGKGGNTPAYGANVNIYGGIYKDNAQFGIGYLYASGHNPASGIVQGAVIVDNPIGLKVQANCNVTAISCLYKNNTVEKEVNGTLTEYNIDIPECDCDTSGDSGDTGINNLLKSATDTDRTTIYNGIGYKTLTRLSSDGTVKSVVESATYAAICATGFIPAVVGDVLRVSGIGHITGTAEYIIAYDSNNAVTNKVQINVASGGGSLGIWDSSVTENASFELTLTEELFGSGFDSIRLSGVIDDTTIITINQEIT